MGLLNPYPLRLQPHRDAVTRVQGTILEPKLISTMWSAPGYPLSMLCQKLLICEEFTQYRGRLGLLTPFRLTWRMVCREPMHVSFQGFGFHLLHVYVRDWLRIWGDALLVPAFARLWRSPGAEVRRLYYSARRLSCRVAAGFVGGAVTILRLVGLGKLFSLSPTFNTTLLSGLNSPSDSEPASRTREDDDNIVYHGNSRELSPKIRLASPPRGTVTNDITSRSSSKINSGTAPVEFPNPERGQSDHSGPSADPSSQVQQQIESDTNFARILMKYATEMAAYPFLILHNRAIFVSGTTKDFWRLNYQILQLYGLSSFFEGLPLYMTTVVAEDFVQMLIAKIINWKLSDLSQMDLTMVRLSFSVLFGQFLSPFVQLVSLRRGESSYFISKNAKAIQAVNLEYTRGVPSSLKLPEAQPVGLLLQRMCMRTMLYQLALTGVIVGVNYAAAMLLNMAEREERERNREREN
ncbi:unnamed protein product [Amoebophrya sp. A120]|nr:unnamed protein product [Amoebophrya sp. A120]|eukprot:GSA120T00024088001.1